MTKKVTAIIQARMNSTRLPGKVMMNIMGKPMLSYMIERLRRCDRIDQIILSTTQKNEDLPIIEFAEQERIICYRGSEDDVLDRYYQTSKLYNIKHVMRLTGDCPLIEPSICCKIVDLYFNSQSDYVRTGETYAEGLDCEVFSFYSIEKSWKNAKLKSEREHVTLYMRNHPEIFKLDIIENFCDDSRFRITVDEIDDFKLISRIIEELYQKFGCDLSFEHIRSFLENNPEIFKINCAIVRNEGLLISLSKD